MHGRLHLAESRQYCLGVTTTGQNEAPLFTALAAAAEGLIGDFISQELADEAWASAAADQSDVSLFSTWATAAEQCIGNFNSQEVAPTQHGRSQR